MSKFIDFSKQSERNELKRKLSFKGANTELTFRKDDGTVRTIVGTLCVYELPANLVNVEINTPRSIFLRVYDMKDRELKTIRWDKIIEVGKRGQSKMPNLATAQLIQDLQTVGFVNGQPIKDSMLLKFADIREQRAVAPLVDELNKLTGILAKIIEIASVA